MNTDNMSIAGETIDYGPCAFMDVYHAGTVQLHRYRGPLRLRQPTTHRPVEPRSFRGDALAAACKGQGRRRQRGARGNRGVPTVRPIARRRSWPGVHSNRICTRRHKSVAARQAEPVAPPVLSPKETDSSPRRFLIGTAGRHLRTRMVRVLLVGAQTIQALRHPYQSINHDSAEYQKENWAAAARKPLTRSMTDGSRSCCPPAE